jgi:hypothetical protein
MRALLMRLIPPLLVLLLVGCNQDLKSRPPLTDRLYYPTGLAFAPGADGGLGRLWVASSDFDRRFDTGWVTTIDLEQVRSSDGGVLPPPGQPFPLLPDGGVPDPRPVQFTQLGTTQDSLVVMRQFAGLATLDLQRQRLFVPSRAEDDYLTVIDTSTPPNGGAPVRCFFSAGKDCQVDAIPLALEQRAGALGIPAAPEPYSVSLANDTDEVFVTHLKPASVPPQSPSFLQNFLVTLRESQLDAAREAFPTVGRYIPPDDDFTPIGVGSSNNIVVTPTYLFISGRAKVVSGQLDVLLRLVDRATRLTAFPQLQLTWASLDARGLQLRRDGQRLYLAADNPPTLLVVDILNTTLPGLAPGFSVVRGVPLPAGPNEVRLIERGQDGQGNERAPLVAVSCVVDGSIVLYDDDLGQVAALIPGVGAEPYSMALDRRPEVTRLYISNFADGRIAVIDVPTPLDGGTPGAPRFLGHIGKSQFCVVATDQRDCTDPVP